MNGGAVEYGLIFVASALLSLLLTPLALRLALARNVLDEPGGYKGHASAVPYLGGVAILVSFAAAVVVAAVIRPPVSGLDELVAIMTIAVLLGFLGLLDDLHGLGPWPRLLVEFGAAVGLWFFDVRILLFTNDALNAVVTVVWVVAIVNAFNLLDNMDGLSAGVAAIAAAWFFIIAAANGQFLVAGLACALTGCALGFLRHNFHPARIYMGDAGALFLGFILAVLGIKLRFDGDTQTTFLVPLLVLGVAVFDTTLVVCARALHRRPLMEGARDHVSHRLVFVGIPVPAAVSLIYCAGVALGWLGLVVSRVDRASAYLAVGLVAAVASLVGILLAVVPVYETSRRRHLMIKEVAAHEVERPQLPLDVRETGSARSLAGEPSVR